MTIYTIGTRGSLLAITQSTLVKNQLESFYPEHKFLLKTIKTQGDEVTNKPLWQLEGKDFFTKELDDAHENGSVDFVIHSCKDLSTQRPSRIKIAAITKRILPHDIILATTDTVKKIQNKKIDTLSVGTSSPRRQYLLKNQLKDFLPFGKSLTLDFKNLRGNVNTRIEKLKNGEFDLICLAAAGLEKLSLLPESNLQLSKLLGDLEFKLLPLSEFPSAPAQGALAVECLSENTPLIALLSKLNCTQTAAEVAKEREVFKKYGGGCHLAVGVSAKTIINTNDESHIWINAKGEVDNKPILLDDSNIIFSTALKNTIKNSHNIFLGLPIIKLQDLNLKSPFFGDITKAVQSLEENQVPKCSGPNPCYYLNSDYTLPAFKKHIEHGNLENKIWASGSNLHQKLSDAGYWVTGDNDSLGISLFNKVRFSGLGNYLFTSNTFINLSYEQHIPIENFIPWGTYRSFFDTAKANSLFLEQIKDCSIFFWTSSKQFIFYQQNYPSIVGSNKYHFCGSGKTFSELCLKSNLQFIPCPSIQDFISQIKNILAKERT